jgi:hypothetical protein
MQFRTVLATAVDMQALQNSARDRAVRVRSDLSQPARSVLDNLDAFDKFFALNGQRSPLSAQLTTTSRRGFPATVPPPVLALLVLEAATGVLMGVQDLDAIQGWAELDVLASAGSFVHMNGATVNCPVGDIVVRDAAGIVASLFRGPDHRTAVTPATTSLVFYVFDVHPTIGAEHGRACEMVSSLLATAAATTTVLSASPVP